MKIEKCEWNIDKLFIVKLHLIKAFKAQSIFWEQNEHLLEKLKTLLKISHHHEL